MVGCCNGCGAASRVSEVIQSTDRIDVEEGAGKVLRSAGAMVALKIVSSPR